MKIKRCNRALLVRRRPLAAIAAVAGCLAGIAPGLSAAVPDRIDFNFHIRPILSDRCYPCHGPDETARKAHLRLDRAEAVGAQARDGTPLLAAGRPADSAVYRRISSSDPGVRMPPPESKLALTAEEIQLIRRWILQGAEYKRHWSLIPLAPVTVPDTASDPWARNPIDAFVLATLQREGLRPAPEAPKEILIRRLSLDLRGLPPSLDEIDAFLADLSPGAYERLVDRFLQSEAYGERRANEWLDLARYADTYGYQADVDYDMSPWRDWVIRAFNQNLPYDQFIVWQLAGDLLPNPTRTQVLATAFNRLHRQTNEGGSIEEEFRVEYVADRVHTFGTAFLGLTLECSRCHDHKFDPITQKDYYQLFAFFQNIDESGLYSHFTRATPSPSLLLYRPGEEDKHRSLQADIATSEAALGGLRATAWERFNAWRESISGFDWSPQPAAAFAFEEFAEGKTPNRVQPELPAALVDDPAQAPGKFGQAAHFSGDNSIVCRGVGAFRRTDPFSFSLWLKTTQAHPRAVLFHRSRAWTDSGSRGYELLLEENQPSFALVHFWPGNALRVRARQALPSNDWVHLAVTYDGSSRAAGLAIYLNGSPLDLDIVRDQLSKDILHRSEWGDMEVDNIHLTLAGRFRDAGFKNGLIDEFAVFDRQLTPGEVRQLAGATLPDLNLREQFELYLRLHDAEYRAGLVELKRLRDLENDFVNDIPEIMVMRELPAPRPAYILKRGAYHAQGERVEPGTPESILPFPPEYPRNRLGLARWLVDPRHPLTARVAVNRAWATHFGRGLVATPNDFGSQGSLPTHPQLLDWLAHRFLSTGWDLKALHKLIALSATYRQSSQANPSLLTRDPENRLLARGPRHRLQAEQIRDSALAASGLLVPTVGGPSVKPYQPAGLWEESGTGKHYVQDKGEKLYRRSLYTFWRRTAPPPSMLSFDATSREVCFAKRETTSTPLQALVLLNDPQFVEAARVLAERLLAAEEDDLDTTIQTACRLTLGRRPDVAEQRILRQLYQEQFDRFTASPELARDLLATGEFPRLTTRPAEQVAATAVLVSALMNHHEFVTKR